MSLRRVGHLLQYIAARSVISIVQAMRMETCQALCRWLAIFLYDYTGLRRKVLDENIDVVIPHATAAQKRQLGIGTWEHLLLMTCEIMVAPRKIHETNWREYFSIPQKNDIVRAMLMPRPKVAVTAHFGNFEIAGYITGLLGFSTYTVARTLDNPYFDEYLNRLRSTTGQFILPKVGSAPQADVVMQSGGTLVLLGDQHAGTKGCWVEFMGKPTSCHKALALFTLISQAPMIVVHCRRGKKPMQFEFGLLGLMDPLIPAPELASVKTLTQWYNRILEVVIRQNPEQYWWVHRRWRDEDAPKSARKKAEAEVLLSVTPGNNDASSPEGPPLTRSAA